VFRPWEENFIKQAFVWGTSSNTHRQKKTFSHLLFNLAQRFCRWCQAKKNHINKILDLVKREKDEKAWKKKRVAWWWSICRKNCHSNLWWMVMWMRLGPVSVPSSTRSQQNQREKKRERERERERMVSRKSTHKHPLAMGVISSTERTPINFTHNKSYFSGKKMYLIFCIKRQNLSTVLICYNIFRSIIILFIISITETTQHHT